MPTASTLECSTSSRFMERANAEEARRWHSQIGNPARLVSRYCTFIPKFWDDFGVSLLASDRMLCIGRSPAELLAGQCGFTRPRRSGGLRAPPPNSPGMERRQRAHERDRLKFVVHGAMRSRSRLGIGRAHRHNDHAASLCRSVHEVVTPYRLAKRNPQTIPRGGRTASPTSTAPVPK